MKREISYLGVGLLFSLSSLRRPESFLPWQSQLCFGLGLLVYGTYLLMRNYEKSKTLIYIIPAWIILVIGGFWTVSISNDNGIQGSDLNASSNFQDIKTCEEGKLTAERDLENGKLRYIFGSFGSRQSLMKNLKDYDIEIIEVDGMLGIPNECYNQVMYKEIQKKYGEDVFVRGMDE